jgi:hypothetical protein
LVIIRVQWQRVRQIFLASIFRANISGEYRSSIDMSVSGKWGEGVIGLNRGVGCDPIGKINAVEEIKVMKDAHTACAT